MRCGMKSEDWEKIRTIFNDALDLPLAEREDFLLRASGESELILSEVRSFLDAYENEVDVLDDPVLELGLSLFADHEEPPFTGQTIGNFRIGRKLGKGGMGDVYFAEDPQLNRPVAIKFLSSAFLHDNWAKRQLKREAQAVALLQHQNVCQVYRFEEIGEHYFIVMQYVEGETLSTLIREKRITIDEGFPIAVQIVDAIAAAHNNDVIHRDIKPGNVIITADGEVKVLDFGLAKIVHDRNKPATTSDRLTQATQKGLILGTIAYMSPEQHKGEELDYRTDVFSLGTVLYELTTGEHPFERKSNAETVTAILSGEAGFERSPGDQIRPGLRRIIKKCLETDRDNRYSNAGELLGELKALKESPFRELTTRYWKAAATLILLLVIVAGVYFFLREDRVYGVAILPFANETADAGFDYLADGIAESLSGKLVESNGFWAIAYSKVAGLTAANANANAIGRNVKADLVLTGRIYRDDDKLAVETKLIDASDGRLLRVSLQELSVSDIPTLENELLEKMFSGLEIRAFTVSANSDREKGQTKNGEAIRRYYVGRHLWRKRDPENLQKAIAAFQQAIEIDPAYSRAYAGLADSYVLMSSVAYGSTSPKESFARARAAAKQAIDLDPLNAEAHTSLGVVLTKHDWNWSEAEREYRQAIKIDPENAGAYYWLSGLLGITGRAEESIAVAEKAKELDPFSPLVEYNLARAYYFARRYDRSLEVLNRQTLTEKNDTKFRFHTGYIYLMTGREAEALQAFEEVYASNKMLGIAALGYTYAKIGRRKDALNLIAELERSAKDTYVPPQEIAIIYMGLGDKDKAFHYLNEAYKERYGSLSAIKVEPLFDPIRDDMRFADLLRQMALN